MFCPTCGAQNPDGATFCGSCGGSMASAPQAQPQAQANFQAQPQGQPQAQFQPQPTGAVPYAPGPGGAAAAPKGGVNNRTVLIGLIAVAAVVVIAIIVGVVTCSGGAGKVNLNSLVSDKPDAIAGQLEKMSKGKDSSSGQTFLAPNDEMRDLLKKASKAFNRDKKDMKNLKEDIQKLSPWCIMLADDDGEFLDASDVKSGDDPSVAYYSTYRILDKPTPEDIAKIVREACTYDKIIVGQTDDDFAGYARTDDCIIRIMATEYEGVYGVGAICYRLDEVDNDDSLEDYFDDYYDDYEDKDFDEYYLQ